MRGEKPSTTEDTKEHRGDKKYSQHTNRVLGSSQSAESEERVLFFKQDSQAPEALD